MRHLMTPGATRPGAMTAVMRAARLPDDKRVVRVARIVDGQITEERICRRGQAITVGSREDNHFVVATPGFPERVRLFEGGRGGLYHLKRVAGMRGRVASGGAVVELAEATSDVLLDDEARGRVVIGGSTFLFQVVLPAAPSARPALPLSVKRSMTSEIDWSTTIIAAFSFLFHFGLVGSVYSDWMDPVLDDELRISQLVESVRELPAPPLEAADAPAARPDDKAVTGEAPATAKPVAGKPTASGDATSAAPSAMGDARAHALSSELAALDLQMLTALGGSDSAIANVLDGANVPTSLLDAAAASAAGARPGEPAGLHMSNGATGPLRPGQTAGKPIGNLGQGDPATTSGQAVATQGPRAGVGVSPPLLTGGTIPGAEAVVAGMTPGFRRCYQNGIDHEDPSMAGSVRILAKIGMNGEVLGVSASGGGGLSASVIGCVTARVASAQFSPPVGGGANLVIPVTFRTQ